MCYGNIKKKKKKRFLLKYLLFVYVTDEFENLLSNSYALHEFEDKMLVLYVMLSFEQN